MVDEPRETVPQVPAEDLADEELLDGVWDDEAEEGADDEPRIEFLAFEAGEEQYAVNVFEVREIVKYQPVTVVPRCPDYLLGVISLRGDIFPVIDLAARLGLGSTGGGEERMVVIVHHGNEPAGVLVARVTGILVRRESEVEPLPDVVSPEKADFFKGVIRTERRLASILNMEHLLDTTADFRTRE